MSLSRFMRAVFAGVALAEQAVRLLDVSAGAIQRLEVPGAGR